MKNGIDMALEPRDLLTGAEWLIAAGTLMTTLFLGVRKMYRTAKNVDDALTMVQSIKKQFEPNGGSSLHDKMLVLDKKIDENRVIASEAAESVHDIHERLGRLESLAMKRRHNDEG